MKDCTVRVFCLLLALASASSWACAQSLPSNFVHSGDGLVRSNLIWEFRSRLEAAVEGRDFAAIQGLYQTNGVDAEELKFELARWKELLDAHTGERVSLWFKELATLPPQARERWTKYARDRTERDVTHLVFLLFPPGNQVQLGLPLVVVAGRLLIVPSEKKNTASVIEPVGPANESLPIRSETNRASSAAGSRR